MSEREDERALGRTVPTTAENKDVAQGCAFIPFFSDKGGIEALYDVLEQQGIEMERRK